MKNIKIIFIGSLICLIVTLFSLWRISANEYKNEKEKADRLNNELNHQKEYIEQKSKEHDKLIIKYNNIMESIESDECGKSPIPEYLKIAIKEILDE